MRLYLIGMPFSGKTFLGKNLAEMMKVRFLDTDETIEHKTGYRIQELFDKHGVAYFRQLESEVLHEIADHDIVVSTGGGMPCYNNNIRYMNATGVTLHLNSPLDILIDRAKCPSEASKRPHWAKLNENEIIENLNTMSRERSDCYNMAQLEFTGTDAALLLEILKTKSEIWR